MATHPDNERVNKYPKSDFINFTSHVAHFAVGGMSPLNKAKPEPSYIISTECIWAKLHPNIALHSPVFKEVSF